MEFLAIDFETANWDLASICQVGTALFRDGAIVQSWGSFVNPEDEFDPINVSIHGIDEDQVRGAPTWPEVISRLTALKRNRIVVSHTAFDRIAFARACAKYDLEPGDFSWLDSAKVVRRAWLHFSRSGYGLSNMAEQLGIEYKAHDATEDARCAGEILLRAVNETGLSLEQWTTRVNEPIDPGRSRIERAGNSEGELTGEVLVFTGALSMLRREAADAAAAAGCRVDSGVTKHTTILVVGDQDIRRLNGHEKSSKHMKAEDLIRNGQSIRILGQSDFLRVIGNLSGCLSPILHRSGTIHS